MTDVPVDLDLEQIGVISWEDPPPILITPPTPVRRAWQLVAADLRRTPGKWGRVHNDAKTNAASISHRINSAGFRWFRPAGAYVAVQRRMPNGMIRVYAVYVGPNREYAELARIDEFVGIVALPVLEPEIDDEGE